MEPPRNPNVLHFVSFGVFRTPKWSCRGGSPPSPPSPGDFSQSSCPPKDVLRKAPRNLHGTPTGEPGSPRPVLSDVQGIGRLPFMSYHGCKFAQQRRLHLAEKSSVQAHKIDLVVQSLLGGPICGRLQRMVACSWKKVESLSKQS